MERDQAKEEKVVILVFILISLVLLGVGMFLRYTPSSTKDWLGEWEVAFFYEHQPELVYQGRLFIGREDSLYGNLEIFGPNSIKPEQLTLQDLSFSNSGAHLKGHVLYGWKINGGYLRESFELIQELPGILEGHGKCLEFCAEGTEGVGISWKGRKKKSELK